MGGKSKSKSSTPKPVDTAALQQKGADQQSRMFSGAERQYGNLQTAMLGHFFPGFGEMVKGGMESFSQNPMANVMGAALGLPYQMETPGFIDDFINKYNPPVEQQPQPQPQQPQPFNGLNGAQHGMPGYGMPGQGNRGMMGGGRGYM